jgi:CRP/FNR family transcriptional regulator, cyclic AMP receptor protein
MSVHVLATIPLFHGLPEPALTVMMVGARPRHFPPETVLIHQGDSSNCLHVIQWGSVRVEREHPDLSAPVILAVLGPGEVVGEMGLLDEAPRAATVVAIESTQTLELTVDALSDAILRFPEVSRALLGTLSRRLRTIDELAIALRRREMPTK